MQLIYKESISVDDYLLLRKSVEWIELCREQAQRGLENSAYIISCYDNTKVVGTARIVWDRGYIAYLSDVIVSPEYQGNGIGKHMVDSAIEFVKSQLKTNWKIKIVLISAKGKELFYKKFGFNERPNNESGSGMDLWVF